VELERELVERITFEIDKLADLTAVLGSLPGEGDDQVGG
jgi:hypothetical protein